MGKRLSECGHCGRGFRPGRYNHSHQKYCLDRACVAERKRLRQRRSYRRRLDRNEGFRESERLRCRAAMRRLRARCRAGPCGGAVGLPAWSPTELVLAGLIAQLTGTADPEQVLAFRSACLERGRCLAVRPLVRGSPH